MPLRWTIPELLEAELIALGAHDTAIAGRFVSAPIVHPSLENVVPLKFARQALSKTNAGQVTSQGDHVMRARTLRETLSGWTAHGCHGRRTVRQLQLSRRFRR